MPQKKRPVTKSGRPRARKGVKLTPTELAPPQLALAERPPELDALAGEIERDGGAVLAAYREPLGGHALIFAALPVEKVERTPFQRDVSDAHVRKLTLAMDKTRRYLDPIVVVREGPLAHAQRRAPATALKELGARSVLALVVPEKQVAYQILALNIEKAHNLREKALEVGRMYRDLADTVDPKESEMALEFEEAGLATLGFAYEERPRLSGSAYAPILKKVDAFLEEKLSPRSPSASGARGWCSSSTTRSRRRWLKERGFESPYLKAFVVARVNPLRFMKGGAPPFDELFAQMTKRARAWTRRRSAARTWPGPAAPRPRRSERRHRRAVVWLRASTSALLELAADRRERRLVLQLGVREEVSLLPAHVPLEQVGERGELRALVALPGGVEQPLQLRARHAGGACPPR